MLRRQFHVLRESARRVSVPIRGQIETLAELDSAEGSRFFRVLREGPLTLSLDSEEVVGVCRVNRRDLGY
jgi:hypothetical protein